MANKLIESKTGPQALIEPDGRTKLAQDVKQAFHAAFLTLQKGGGKYSLIAWAKKHPTEFYKLCQRFVPSDLHVSGSVALEVVTGVPSVESLIDDGAQSLSDMGGG